MNGRIATAWVAKLEAVGLALDEVPRPGEWVERGRCRSAPPTIFFPARGDNGAMAKQICNICPVIVECRAYALAHHELQGVWGGLTDRERRAVRDGDEVAPAPVVAAPPRERQRNYRGELYRVLEQLTEHPGRWARVARYASRHSAHSMASLLRAGQRTVPAGSWQFEGRVNDEGGSDLYALFGPERSEVAS